MSRIHSNASSDCCAAVMLCRSDSTSVMHIQVVATHQCLFLQIENAKIIRLDCVSGSEQAHCYQSWSKDVCFPCTADMMPWKMSCECSRRLHDQFHALPVVYPDSSQMWRMMTACIGSEPLQSAVGLYGLPCCSKQPQPVPLKAEIHLPPLLISCILGYQFVLACCGRVVTSQCTCSPFSMLLGALHIYLVHFSVVYISALRCFITSNLNPAKLGGFPCGRDSLFPLLSFLNQDHL